MQAAIAHLRQRLVDLHGSPLKTWSEAEWTQLAIEAFNWRMSQFLHGEQGALVCTAKIVETVPWIDAKYYASTQVMDEARHVEVFARYLDTKLDGHYPVNPALQLLIDDIVARRPLGHDLHGHADHDRGSRARGLRLHARGHPGAAPQEAAALRDERRGPPRRVRRAVAARSTTSSSSGRRDPRAPGVRVRGRRCACATG